MIRMLLKLISLLIIAAIVFFALSLWQGGKPFRWFGQKSEQAGEILKKKSEEVGDQADKLKEKSEDIRDTTKKVGDGMRRAGEKIRDVTGSKTDK